MHMCMRYSVEYFFVRTCSSVSLVYIGLCVYLYMWEYLHVLSFSFNFSAFFLLLLLLLRLSLLVLKWYRLLLQFIFFLNVRLLIFSFSFFHVLLKYLSLFLLLLTYVCLCLCACMRVCVCACVHLCVYKLERYIIWTVILVLYMFLWMSGERNHFLVFIPFCNVLALCFWCLKVYRSWLKMPEELTKSTLEENPYRHFLRN